MNLTKDTYDEIVNQDEIFLVDFWASWCPPCKALGPILDRFSEKTGVKILKVNVDTEPELARRFEIMSLPTILVTDKGEVKGQLIGAKSLKDIEIEVDKILNP